MWTTRKQLKQQIIKSYEKSSIRKKKKNELNGSVHVVSIVSTQIHIRNCVRARLSPNHVIYEIMAMVWMRACLKKLIFINANLCSNRIYTQAPVQCERWHSIHFICSMNTQFHLSSLECYLYKMKRNREGTKEETGAACVWCFISL